MSRLPVGVVGVGHLGKEHARILSTLPGVELVGVADARANQAEAIAARCGTVAFTDHRLLCEQIRAAVVAVPTTFHHAVAGELLARGIHVLVEKPLASTPAQAEELAALARARGVVLQVGHIERFNPAFEELQRRGTPSPKYIQARRCGGFTGRSLDIGVVLDLMIHDLDLVLELLNPTGAKVARVEALGVSVLGGHEDLAQARLTFADGCVVDLSASRLSPTAVRSMQVWGPEGCASIDFARRLLTLTQPGSALRNGWSAGLAHRPDLPGTDPGRLAGSGQELLGRYLESAELDCNFHQADQLTRELEDFLSCIRTGRNPRVPGEAGQAALTVAWQVLEALDVHAWEGTPDGPVGPHQLPAGRGPLFLPRPEAEAA